MKAKQIEACDVLTHLYKGKDIICLDFGRSSTMCGVDKIRLNNERVGYVFELVGNPDNMFFEEVKDDVNSTEA